LASVFAKQTNRESSKTVIQVYWAPYALHKGKEVPLQVRRGPEGSKKLRFPDFVITIVKLTHRPPLPQVVLVLISVRS